MPSIGPDDPARHPGQIGQASPLLFTALVDDAAMFPPGNAPLGQALSEHLRHRSSWYADLVGPLLIPASGLAALIELVAAQHISTPLPVGLIASSGLDEARAAVGPTGATGGGGVEVVAVELRMHAADDVGTAWASLAAPRRAIWWEVDRGADLRGQLDRLSAVAATAGPGGAKLRTGGVEPSAFPSEAEVAVFLRHVIDVDLTFKLTAGLHHAVRVTDPATGLEQHGVLNVLCAIKAALNGAEEVELEEVLAERDPAPLVVRCNGMSEADASVIRAFWSSFGCCGVTDPIGELVALGLVAR